MDAYWRARGVAWDPQRFVQSWRQFESHVILRSKEFVGVLQLREVEGTLEIRDLQLLAAGQGQGIGTWAIAQTRALALDRQIPELGLRVLVENRAQRHSMRLGFQRVAIDNGIIHRPAP